MVQEVEVVLGRHRSVKFLVITNLGLLCMRDIGEEIRLWDYIGHVSFEQRLYQVLVAYSYRNAGHQAFENDTGKTSLLVDAEERVERSQEGVRRY